MKKIFTFLALILSLLVIAACEELATGMISFDDDEVTINVGQSYTLTYELSEGFEIELEISNLQVLKLENGTVTGLSVGEATVTATIEGTKISDSILVKVIEPQVTTIPVTSINITGSQTGQVGQVVTLIAEVLPANATDKTVVWTSSDQTVATVNNGQVTLVKAGTVTITATQGTITKTHQIVIIDKVVETTAINLEGASTGFSGETLTLTATVVPSNATNKTVAWTSSDETIATVANGVVTMLKAGTVTITATQGTITKTHQIVITDKVILATDIEITMAPVNYINEDYMVIAKVLPLNATNQLITWTSSDNLIAYVDENGMLKLLKEGTVTLTATSGTVVKTVEIEVIKRPVVASVAIVHNDLLTFTQFDKVQYMIDVKEEGSIASKIVWTVSDQMAAMVAPNGEITFLQVGTVTITVTVDETFTDSIEVTNNAFEFETLLLEGEPELALGQETTLIVKTNPNLTFPVMFTWTSSDESVLTVNQMGLVTTVGEGTATITVSYGSKSATHEIKVENSHLAFIGETGYDTLALAIAAANEGDVIELLSQTISANLTVKSGITITSRGSDKVVFTGVLTLPTGTKNVKLNSLEFTLGSYIYVPGTLDGFEFTNNYVYDSTIAKTAFAPTNRIDVNAFIRMYVASGTQIIGNLLIDGNIFENMSSDIITFSRTSQGKTVQITNNEFLNFPNSAIRVDGGYNAGTYIIKNNMFANEMPETNMNAILFRAFSADTNQQQFIHIEENTFINMGTLRAAIADDYLASAIIGFSTYNDRHSVISISKNVFDGGANAIHFRNRPAATATLVGMFNYNEFRNVAGYYLYEALTNAALYDADFNYNLFVDGNGNEITDLEVLTPKILNHNKTYVVYEKPIDLLLGQRIERNLVPTMYVDPNLDDHLGEHVGGIGLSFINGVTAFKTIQEAINAATPNTIIYVAAHTFAENVLINKDGITLLGANYFVDMLKETRSTETVLTGQITIGTDVNNIKINGFTFSGSARVINEGTFDGLFFMYNKVSSSLLFTGTASAPEGFIKISAQNATQQHHNLYLVNNEFKYTGASSPRYLLGQNLNNVYVVGNEFNSSNSAFTDSIRITGYNNTNDSGSVLTGDFFVYNNLFKDAGQAAIFVTQYSNLNAQIINNEFRNIRTTAVRLRFNKDQANNTESIIVFNFNKADVNASNAAGNYIYAALRVEQAKTGAVVIANYNHFINIPFNYYVGGAEQAFIDARYNYYASEVDFIPQTTKLDTVDMFEGYYTSEEELPKYNEKLIIKPSEVSILNKITELEELDTHMLVAMIGPDNATNKKLVFTTSDPNIAVIDATGKIMAKNAGTVTITVASEESPTVFDTMELTVTQRERVEVNFDGPAFVVVGNFLQLNAVALGTDKVVTFESNNNEIATVDATGKVTGLTEGIVVITVKLGDEVAYEIELAVYVEVDHVLGFLLENANNIISAQSIMYIGSDDGSLDYNHIIGESVSNLLFSNMNITRNMIPTTNSNYRSTQITKLEWVVIHDTANTSAGAGGQANSNWATNPTNTSSSWHYTIGNDGFYQQIENNLIGLHAGDGSTQTTFLPTGIIATDYFPLVLINEAGYFTINGIATTIQAPMMASGLRATNNDITEMGIRAVVNGDGTYHLPQMYQNSNFGRKLGMRGGNANGIGIEMAVNRGSDVWLTWQRTAKLTAKLLVENGLSIDRVVFHNHFSGKPCPRTMLESGNLDKFMKMIEAEYKNLIQNQGYQYEFISTVPTIVNNQGRVVSIPQEDTFVNYAIKVTSPTNEVKTYNFTVLIKGQV